MIKINLNKSNDLSHEYVELSDLELEAITGGFGKSKNKNASSNPDFEPASPPVNVTGGHIAKQPNFLRKIKRFW